MFLYSVGAWIQCLCCQTLSDFLCPVVSAEIGGQLEIIYVLKEPWLGQKHWYSDQSGEVLCKPVSLQTAVSISWYW